MMLSILSATGMNGAIDCTARIRTGKLKNDATMVALKGKGMKL